MKKAILVAGLLALVLSSDATAQVPAFQCIAPVDKVTSVGVTAVACPTVQYASRRVVTICNSAENAGSPQIKVRIDGTAPVFGSGTPGTVLAKGACATFFIQTAIVPKCIADTAATAVSSIECR